jgi:hypothetical protein
LPTIFGKTIVFPTHTASACYPSLLLGSLWYQRRNGYQFGAYDQNTAYAALRTLLEVGETEPQ